MCEGEVSQLQVCEGEVLQVQVCEGEVSQVQVCEGEVSQVLLAAVRLNSQHCSSRLNMQYILYTQLMSHFWFAILIPILIICK